MKKELKTLYWRIQNRAHRTRVIDEKILIYKKDPNLGKMKDAREILNYVSKNDYKNIIVNRRNLFSVARSKSTDAFWKVVGKSLYVSLIIIKKVMKR